jgi:hypothetical protein
MAISWEAVEKVIGKSKAKNTSTEKTGVGI